MSSDKNAAPAQMAPKRQSVSYQNDYTPTTPSGQVFSEVKRLVSARDAAELYGVRLDRSGRALCPFHNDTHPSMSFKGQTFRCWACGAHGSAIDFAAGLFGLSPIDAVRKLSSDFSLGLPLDQKPTAADHRQAEQRQHVRAVRADFESWRERTMLQLCDAHRIGISAAGKDPDELTDAEAVALRWLEVLDFWESELESNDLDRQMAVFRARREVEALCAKILSATQMKSSAA